MKKLFNKTKIALLLFTLLILVLYQGCSKKSDSNNPVSSGTSSSNEILIQGMAFSPADITVSVGTTITWTNKDAVAHTVTSGVPGSISGQFDSGNISQNGNFKFTFSQTGTFKYFCKIHTSMTGTITVQ